MQRITHLLLILQLTLSALGQEVQTFQFDSNELGEFRTLKIYIPNSYNADIDKRYPLTIILDADYLFDVYTGNLKLFNHYDMVPEQIVVGIMQKGNNSRQTDIEIDKVTGLPTEFGERFYRFIKGELLLSLEQQYRLAPFKTIIGNNATANYLNFFAIEQDRAFDAFVCINPYYTQDMGGFIENAFSTMKDEKLYYYVNSGTYNNETRHKQIEDVVYALKNIVEKPNLLIKYERFDNSSKVSSIGQGVAGALGFIFRDYAYIADEEFDTNIKDLPPPEAIDYLKKKYIDIEYLFGTNLKIRERDIYKIESIVIDQADGQYLPEFGAMILKLHPKSPIGDYYIGLYYEMQGDYKKALKHYKNGYVKMAVDSQLAEAYYYNIERVQGLKDNVEMQKLQEKLDRKAKKNKSKDEGNDKEKTIDD